MNSFPVMGLAALVSSLALTAPAFASGTAANVHYADPQLRQANLRQVPLGAASHVEENAILREMRVAAERFEHEWGDLPQIELDKGPVLKLGARGQRVAELRERLGVPRGDIFDNALVRRVEAYRAAHGLGKARHVDNAMIESLNRGYDHYARVIDLNLARLAALPADLGERFILVDAAEQRLYMYEDGEIADSMKVIVGKQEMPTPMIAGKVRYAVVNPYWNVPPDLTRDNIAPKVLEGGKAYLERTGFEALSGWTDDARVLSYEEVDWQAVADGEIQLRVRQKPGPGNGMGEVKFVFPNRLGIYLHDTPSRELFNEEERLFSSGCIRLEDAWELADWLFDERPRARGDAPEQEVKLDEPVPVYVTYLTAVPDQFGFDFREDIYGRDNPAVASR